MAIKSRNRPKMRENNSGPANFNFIVKTKPKSQAPRKKSRLPYKIYPELRTYCCDGYFKFYNDLYQPLILNTGVCPSCPIFKVFFRVDRFNEFFLWRAPSIYLIAYWRSYVHTLILVSTFLCYIFIPTC